MVFGMRRCRTHLSDAAEEQAKLALERRPVRLLVQADNLRATRSLARLGAQVGLILTDPPWAEGKDFTKNGRLAYSDRARGSDYRAIMRERLAAARRLLDDNANAFVHISDRLAHPLRTIMDEVLGSENFVQEIVRIRIRYKNCNHLSFGRTSDRLLFYRASTASSWVPPRQPIEPQELARLYPHERDGRRYRYEPLSAKGRVANGATGRAWREVSPPSGRHWRWLPGKLDEMERRGLIDWSHRGNPRLMVFEDNHKGKKLQDILVAYPDPTRTLYPSQKNLNLYRMLVSAASTLGGIVIDLFCGSGTSLVAAEMEGRSWVGIDSSPLAIETALKRLEAIGVPRHQITLIEDL
jgi:adenine-specific DNA-methyltransferase